MEVSGELRVERQQRERVRVVRCVGYEEGERSGGVCAFVQKVGVYTRRERMEKKMKKEDRQ